MAQNLIFSFSLHQTCRYFSRFSKSWFNSRKKNYQVVNLCEVGPKRIVPDRIQKPSYSVTGVEMESKNTIEIFDFHTLSYMKESCSLARTVLEQVAKFIEVGITTDELDSVAHDFCISQGAYPSPLNYREFPKSICTSVNNIACHGIPDSRKLRNGDIISVDVSVFYNGYHGDCAATFCVGDVDGQGRKLVQIASLCLEEGIKTCCHGQDFCAIGKAISKLAEQHGFTVIPAFCGHGIGTIFHSPPSILHYDNDQNGKMEKGMIFTIEPVIGEGRPDVVILEDGWTAKAEDDSRSAQFEHTILITETGAKILTK